MAHKKVSLVVAIALVTIACGSKSPTSPTSPPSPSPPTAPAAPSGSWYGAFELTSCTGGPFGCQLGPESFMLRLETDGSGVLQIHTTVWGPYAAPIAVDVVRQSPAGTETILNGATTATGKNLRVQLTLSDIGDTLKGTIHYTVDHRDSGQVVNDGRILFAARDSFLYLSRFQGDWAGHVSRTQCTGECNLDPIWRNDGIRIALAHTAQSISGVINGWVPVTASAGGDTLNGSVRYSIPPASCRPDYDSGRACLIDATIAASVDAVDRLHGSISYRVEGVTAVGTPFSLDATTSLDGLARWHAVRRGF